MTGKQFHEALNYLDPLLIEKYYTLRDSYTKRPYLKSLHIKIAAMAASVCLVLGGLWIYAESQPKKSDDPSLTATEAGNNTGSNHDPQADVNKPVEECWPGIIANIEINNTGSDPSVIIELSVKDHESIRFTATEDTQYFRSNTQTGIIEEITVDDLYVDAWVEIECKRYHHSDYYEIITVTVIEP